MDVDLSRFLVCVLYRLEYIIQCTTDLDIDAVRSGGYREEERPRPI